MKYREINEHTTIDSSPVSWLNEQNASMLRSGVKEGEIAGCELFQNGQSYGLFLNGDFIAFFQVAPFVGKTAMKRMEIAEQMRGTGLANSIVDFLLSRYQQVVSDDTMTKVANRMFQKLLERYSSGIIDSFTGKVYRLGDAGKEIEGNIIILSPEKDNMNVDRRPNGKPVDRHDYVHRFYWILSSSPLSYEDI